MSERAEKSLTQQKIDIAPIIAEDREPQTIEDYKNILFACRIVRDLYKGYYTREKERADRLETELRDTHRALELAVQSDNDYGRSVGAVHFSTAEEFLQLAREEKLREGK